MFHILSKFTILIALAGCTKPSPSGPNNLIRVGWENKPRTLIDSRRAVDANTQYLEDLIHCSLVRFNTTGSVVPSVSETSKWIDKKTLEIQLRKDVVFSDGSALTAHDVTATYNFFLRKDLKHPTPRAAAFSNVAKIEALGNNKIVFHLKKPEPSFITNNLVVGILPKKFALQENLTNIQFKIPTCGPYTLQSASLNQIHLKPNTRYTLGKKAKNDGIQIKVISDEGTRFSKLIANEVDIIQNGGMLDRLRSIEKYKNLKSVSEPALTTSYVGFNFRDKQLKNEKVRKALAHAINTPAIIKYVIRDQASKADTILLEADPFHNPNLKTYEYSQEKANALLDEAGFKKNPETKIRFKLEYKTTTNKQSIAIGKAMEGDLRKIGIDLQVTSLEWGKFKSDVDKGHVQLWGLAWIGFKEPSIYQYAFDSQFFPPNGPNRGRYKNAKLDLLFKQASQETDRSKSVALYHRIQEIVNNDVPYIFLYHRNNVAIMNKSVQGFQLYADGRLSSLPFVSKITK